MSSQVVQCVPTIGQVKFPYGGSILSQIFLLLPQLPQNLMLE
jgi:hypothetical protein